MNVKNHKAFKRRTRVIGDDLTMSNTIEQEIAFKGPFSCEIIGITAPTNPAIAALSCRFSLSWHKLKSVFNI